MDIQENKTAAQLLRERYFKIKNSRKISPEIIQVLVNYKTFLRNSLYTSGSTGMVS